MNWTEWTLERTVLLFIALSFLLVGIQVALLHYRQNFHHKIMWVPVISAPLFFVTVGWLVLYKTHWLLMLNLWLLWASVVIGFIGFYRHYKGVGVRVGGHEMRNFLIGPPIIMPLLFSAFGALGICTIYFMI